PCPLWGSGGGRGGGRLCAPAAPCTLRYEGAGPASACAASPTPGRTSPKLAVVTAIDRRRPAMGPPSGQPLLLPRSILTGPAPPRHAVRAGRGSLNNPVAPAPGAAGDARRYPAAALRARYPATC